MTQADRDRLVAWNKAEKLITKRYAAAEVGERERQFRRLLKRYRKERGRAVVHGLRDRPSNPRREDEAKQKAIEVLRREECAGIGPTLAGEYLAKKHAAKASKETIRKCIVEGGLVTSPKGEGRVRAHLARAAREVRRLGAIGHVGSRLAGGAGLTTVPDHDDR